MYRIFFCLFVLLGPLFLVHIDADVVTIPDDNLRAVIESALGLNSGEPIEQSQMAEIKELDASNLNITALDGLEEAVNLVELYLHRNQISNISPLAGLSNLKVLYLYSNQISDISALADLNNLTTLRLDANQIVDISTLSNLTNLNQVFLHYNQISDISHLAGMTKLNYLVLYHNQISDISPLAGLTELYNLRLDENRISDISALANLSNLHTLGLSDNQLSDISILSELVNLTWLYLGQNSISDISSLTGLKKLYYLTLYQNQISDISALAELRDLWALSLYSNQISDISPLANLTGLADLHLDKNQISDISSLAELTNLETLALSDNQISDITILSNLGSLLNLYLHDNQISEISSLSTLDNLDTLWLNGNHINISEGSDSLALIRAFESDGTIVSYQPQYLPDISVFPYALKLDASMGDTLTSTLTISNSGNSDLEFTVNSDDAWIAIGIESDRIAPGNSIVVDLSFEVGPDFDNFLTGTITINSNDPGTPGLNIAVELYQPAIIPDRNLRTAIKSALDLDPGDAITTHQLALLDTLIAVNSSIQDLTGLEGATNLKWLNLSENLITNLTPLSNLSNLRNLYLTDNQISEISPLQGLTHLNLLMLQQNYLDTTSGSADRNIIDDIGTHADVVFTPQNDTLQRMSDWLVEQDIPPELSGDKDMPGPLDLPNIVAYSMGINPKEATLEDMPQLLIGESQEQGVLNAFSYIYFRNLNALGIQRDIEVSLDLNTWRPFEPIRENILWDNSLGRQLVEAVFNSSSDQIYLRLIITRE